MRGQGCFVSGALCLGALLEPAAEPCVLVFPKMRMCDLAHRGERLTAVVAAGLRGSGH